MPDKKQLTQVKSALKLAAGCFAVSLLQALGADAPVPPPAPPTIQYQQVMTRALVAAPAQTGSTAATPDSQTLYSIGDPTDNEQLYVELINRARANPNAEAQRLKNTTDPTVLASYTYFGVNLNTMVAQFAAISATPPLSPNADLLAAARVHSADMLANDYQAHVGTDGSQPWDRGTAQGYNWTTYGENIYSYATSVFYGHAGFEVDWGGSASTGGMQSPAGHRANIHSPDFREIGVGVSLGSNGSVGPQLVTQDFGAQPSPTPFITGVVYYDFNNSGFYDVGEGIGGVTVTVAGSSYYAMTAGSGGYSVPVPGNGTYTVTFSAQGMATSQSTVTVSNGGNVKVDYTPVYTAPAITGPAFLSPSQSGSYSFSAVGAASGYEWKQSLLLPFTLVEGAENGMANITADVTSGYAVIETDTVKNGAHAFHLAHPQPDTQVLQFNHTLRVTANSSLTFWSMLGWATSGEVAAAQVSTDGGATWQTVWTQAGTGAAGQTSFSQHVISLSAYAGRDVMVQFAYSANSSSFFPQTDPGVGFYLDDVSVTNAQELTGTVITSAAANSFAFSSASSGTYTLSARALLPGRTLSWGPGTSVIVQAGGQQPTAIITLQASPANGGSVSGGGSFLVGSSQQITATPATGWAFTSWNDGNTSATRTVTVSSTGTTYTASFTQTPVAAQIVSPASGSTLPSGPVLFSWNAGVGVKSYYLSVGNSAGASTLFGATVGSSGQTVSNLPEDGRTIYVTLYSQINGVWKTSAYTYTTALSVSQMQTVNGIAMTGGPIPTLNGTFGWNAGTKVTQNFLSIGSALNGTDIFNKTVTGNSQMVALPADGRTLYVKLYSMINSVWYSQSYVYQAPFVTAVPAVMTSVTTGSNVLSSGSGTFADGPALFSWNQGVLVTAYWLSVGSGPGKSDIYNASEGTKLSQSVTVPKDGRKLYITLSSQIKGAWVTSTYTYTAFTAQAQMLTVNGVSQTTGSLPAGSVTFAWSKGTDLSNPALGNYWLSIGTTAGSGNLYSKQLIGTSVTVPNLPQTGQALYVTLYTNVGGQWLTSSYTYTAF